MSQRLGAVAKKNFSLSSWANFSSSAAFKGLERPRGRPGVWSIIGDKVSSDLLDEAAVFHEGKFRFSPGRAVYSSCSWALGRELSCRGCSWLRDMVIRDDRLGYYGQVRYLCGLLSLVGKYSSSCRRPAWSGQFNKLVWRRMYGIRGD